VSLLYYLCGIIAVTPQRLVTSH